MTDMAVAVESAIFGLPEVKVGVFPMQVMSLLQDIAPRRLINEWALTGEPFDARAAQAVGAVESCGAISRTRPEDRMADRPHRRQVADRDPPRQIRHARDRLDVVRPEHRLHRKPDRAHRDDRGRQRGPRRRSAKSASRCGRGSEVRRPVQPAWAKRRCGSVAQVDPCGPGCRCGSSGLRRLRWGGEGNYPAFAFSPAASMPASAQISSLSEVSPLTPTAPSSAPLASCISTPPGTGTRRPCASVFTALTK